MITDRAMRLPICAIQVIIAALLYVLAYIVTQIIQILHNLGSNTFRFTRSSVQQRVNRPANQKSLESMSITKTSPRDNCLQNQNTALAGTQRQEDTVTDSNDGEGMQNVNVPNSKKTEGPCNAHSSVPDEVTNALCIRSIGEESMHSSHVSVTDMNLADTDSSLQSSLHQFSSIIFPSHTDLNRYILCIHLIGFALWQTFICFECTARDIDLSFVAGLIADWYWHYASAESLFYYS